MYPKSADLLLALLLLHPLLCGRRRGGRTESGSRQSSGRSVGLSVAPHCYAEGKGKRQNATTVIAAAAVLHVAIRSFTLFHAYHTTILGNRGHFRHV